MRLKQKKIRKKGGHLALGLWESSQFKPYLHTSNPNPKIRLGLGLHSNQGGYPYLSATERKTREEWGELYWDCGKVPTSNHGAYPYLSATERKTREEWVFVGLGTGTVGKFPLHIMQISPF